METTPEPSWRVDKENVLSIYTIEHFRNKNSYRSWQHSMEELWNLKWENLFTQIMLFANSISDANNWYQLYEIM